MALGVFAPPADDFKLVTTQQSVTLYERWIMHNGDRVRELKAEFPVNVNTTDKLITTLKNEREGAKWNQNVSQYDVIGHKDENVWLLYIRYHIPWPLDDQDCCMLYRAKKLSENFMEISFESITRPEFPETDKVIRMTGVKGKWLMEKTNAGGFKITYYITSDKSRSLPQWVSDPIVHKNMIKTMSALKDILEG